jgi:hypothetical protein
VAKRHDTGARRDKQRRQIRKEVRAQKEGILMAEPHGKTQRTELWQVQQLRNEVVALGDIVEQQGTAIRNLEDTVLQLKGGADWPARLLGAFNTGVNIGVVAMLVWLVVRLEVLR